MPKKDTSYNDDDERVLSSQVNYDDDDDNDSVHISDDEESARDDYIHNLGALIGKIQEELENEISSDDSISVDEQKNRIAIEALEELLNVRTEQLAEKDLPTHVDEKVEEYR